VNFELYIAAYQVIHSLEANHSTTIPKSADKFGSRM